jgi:hypothetical protein
MRRKVIQDFANTFCQKFLDSPNGYDLARFAQFGVGTATLNILTGECILNDVPVPKFDTCDDHKEWLRCQLVKHNIPKEAIKNAKMTVQFSISDIDIRQSYGHTFRSAEFDFHCMSEIQTDEKSYAARMSNRKKWGFDYYWEKLYDTTDSGIGAKPPSSITLKRVANLLRSFRARCKAMLGGMPL